MIRKISFEIVEHHYEHKEPLEQASEVPSLEAVTPYIIPDIVCLIDGVPLIPVVSAPVFDAISVVTQQLTPDGFNPYTCSCGVPDCAGIYEEAQLLAEEDEVTWAFPECYYKAHLDLSLFDEGQPLRVTFNRAQYLEALAKLKTELIALDTRSEAYVVIAPESFPESQFDTSVEELFASSAAHYANYLAREANFNELYGDLRFKRVWVEFSDGQQLSAVLQYAVQTVSEYYHPHDYDAQRSHESDVLVPAVKIDHSSLFVALKKLPWDEAGRQFWAENTIASEATPDQINARQEMWDMAKLTINTQTL